MPTPDEIFMDAALAEGRCALPACLPNPPVGCVLVRGGQIVARGFTQPPGNPHAEALALAQLDGPLDDVTAYVTLEPCSFHGRTPACAKTLVERGVRRVFVAMLDPDARNNGKGIALLRVAGSEVTVGLREAEARQDLAPHLALPENGAPPGP
jgi:pyrimidine deaminase RibD-like protein